MFHYSVRGQQQIGIQLFTGYIHRVRFSSKSILILFDKQDYHVILVSRLPKGTWPSSIVFDLDTALRKDRGVSIPFHTYAAMTLYNAWSSHSATHELNSYIIPKAPRSFRLIPARDYLTYFASDRSHMIVKSDDGLDVWCSPPPPYDAIVNKCKYFRHTLVQHLYLFLCHGQLSRDRWRYGHAQYIP
jgi:hypothetical protein